MNCESCSEKRKQAEPVPYIVHESAMARMERTVKRLWVLLILLILLFVGTNAAWIWYESQWEVVETTVTQTNEDGYNNFIGNDGDIYNGEAQNSNADDYDQEP